MCGIAGLYHLETAKPVDPARLRAMLHGLGFDLSETPLFTSDHPGDAAAVTGGILAFLGG